MKVEDLEIPPHVDPNFEISQLPWRDDDTMHEKEPIHEETPMEEKVPMHRAYPTQEGTSSQGELPAWVLDLQESLLKIK